MHAYTYNCTYVFINKYMHTMCALTEHAWMHFFLKIRVCPSVNSFVSLSLNNFVS